MYLTGSPKRVSCQPSDSQAPLAHPDEARLTILILVLEEATELPNTHPRKRLSSLAVVEHASGDTRSHALVQERDGRRGGDEVRDRGQQLTDQARLMRS